MDQVEIDVVGAEPPQAVVHVAQDRRAGAIATLRPADDLPTQPALRDEHDLLAPRAERLAEHFLGVAVPVDRRRVEERHAEVDCAMDGANLLAIVHIAVLVAAHLPAAEANRRNLQVGRAHRSVLHRCLLLLRPSRSLVMTPRVYDARRETERG